MIRIDDNLLNELGLMNLPKEERDVMLRHIYETLEMRVGMRLAERMNEQQLDEFEKFIDGDTAFTENYLTTIRPGWEQSDAYKSALISAQQTAQKRGVQFNENSVKSEFGALTWLETNFPDYKQVVATELDKLKVEIKQDSGKILEAMQQGPVPLSEQPQQQVDQLQSQPMPQQSLESNQSQTAMPPNNVVQGDFSTQPEAADSQDQKLQPPAQAA